MAAGAGIIARPPRLTRTGFFFAALPTKRHHEAIRRRCCCSARNWEDDDGFRPEHLIDVSDGFEAWSANGAAEYELARGLSSFPYGYYSALYRLRTACPAARAMPEASLPHHIPGMRAPAYSRHTARIASAALTLAIDLNNRAAYSGDICGAAGAHKHEPRHFSVLKFPNPLAMRR